jgi:ubiquinone/menaquinone biosynthesis C-methylase UbiE
MTVNTTEMAQQWEARHQTMVWGQYPPEPLIRWVARTFTNQADRADLPVLELGCGAGANLWYMAEQGFSVTGIDFSRTALLHAQNALYKRQQTGQLVYGSFLDMPFPDQSFAIVIDLAGTTSLPTDTLPGCFAHIRRVLKPGGHYLCCVLGEQTTMIASADQNDTHADDPSFYSAFQGPLQNAPTARLYTQSELKHLIDPMVLVSLESHTRSEANQTQSVQNYWLHARMPG